MTDILCYQDSYLKTFDATVTAVTNRGVGARPHRVLPGRRRAAHRLWDSDRRRCAVRCKAQSAATRGGTFTRSTATNDLTSASEISGAIDWDRRYQLMRTHTALHILCGVVWRDYGAQVTGGNMEPLRARMDFELESMSADFAEHVEELINGEVAAERDVHVSVLPREEAFEIPDLIRTKINLLPPQITEVRIIDIEGLDLQADGGTHVANTREVGQIRVVGHESKGRINKRLRISVDA